MRAIAKVKGILSILLLCSIFLPISQCDGPVAKGSKEKGEVVENYIYKESGKNFNWHVIAWVMPFFLTLLALKYKRSISVYLLQLIAIIYAGAAWVAPVLWSHKILWGAYFSATVIILYFLLVLFSIFLHARNWRSKSFNGRRGQPTNSGDSFLNSSLKD